MGDLRRLLLVWALLGGSVMVSTDPVSAACHSFTVQASPEQVEEGATVTVTVKRDAAVNPSHVDVSSVDETAHAGPDYTALSRTASFTTDTQQTFFVRTVDDPMSEAAETFRVHLSNPGGCTVNSSFSLGPDARVTINDNDPQPSTASTAPATTAAPGASGTTAPHGAATSTTTTSAATTSTTRPEAATTTADAEKDAAAARPASSHDGGGVSGLAVASALATLGAAATALAYVGRRRRLAGD